MSADGTFLYEARKNAGLTRAEAAEASGIDDARIEKIEMGKVKTIYPEDVVALAKAYRNPELCHHFCKQICELGVNYRDVRYKDLSHIAIETLNSLNKMEQIKERLLDIVEDDIVTEDEQEDFEIIKDVLDRIATAADELKLWCEKMDLK